MSKTKTPAASLIGTTVQLRDDMLDLQGDPHANAGQEVRIIEARARNKFSAEAEGGVLIVIDRDDFTPDAPKAAAAGAAGNPIAYRHPSGDTWSGKGKQPAWVRAALENGRHLSDFAVEKVSELTAPAGPVSAEFAEQLQTINLYTDPTKNVTQLIDLDLIDDSPSQPRTHYPEDYIAGLAASMRAVGMISAMLVRPKGDGRYENVFGHCRKRGARLAGMTQAPVIVRELTDAQSAQLQAVENLQREDLDAIDEAMSFAAYIKAHGCSKDQFCALTGISRTQVYNRLKLATLMPAGQKAMRDGLIKAEVATMIARVPGEKQQAYALKIILDNSTKHPDEPDEVMTVARARAYLREKFTLDLDKALWKIDDATLLADQNGKTLDGDYAVACTVCPKRSGFDQILYVDLLGDQQKWSRTPGGENVCTDPECFDKKKTAHLKREQAALEAKGEIVIAGNKARQTISAEGTVKNGYVALKDVKAEITRINKQAKASGGEAQPVEIITVQNPRDGKTIKVVKVAAIQEAGGKVEEPNAGRHDSRAAEAEREAKKLKAEADTAFYMALFTQVRAAAAKAARTTLDLQLIATRLYEHIDWDEKEIIAAAHGYSRDRIGIQKLEKSIGSMPADQLATLLLDCVLTEDLEQHSYYGSNKPDALLAAAKQYGVDVKAARKEHDKSAKAQVSAPAATRHEDQQEEEAEA